MTERKDELQIFNYEGNNVRTIEKDGEPWWVLKDVCNVLGLTESHRAATRIDEDDRTNVTVTDSIGRNQETTIINESGLYNVILLSRKPEAKEFKRWITHEVLPQIRKTGGYIPVESGDDDAQIMAKALLIAQKTMEQKDRLIAQKEKLIQDQAPKVALANSICASKTVISVGDMAKILKQNGIEDAGQNRFFEWLRQHGYLIQREGTDYNMPTQKSMELGLFEIEENVIKNPNGSFLVHKTTKVTTKGQMYFINKILNRRAK